MKTIDEILNQYAFIDYNAAQEAMKIHTEQFIDLAANKATITSEGKDAESFFKTVDKQSILILKEQIK